MLARNIHDEDTIELQLSATELELLNQAAAEAENGASGKAAPVAQTCATSEQAAAKPELATVAAPAETPPAREVPDAAAHGATLVVPATVAGTPLLTAAGVRSVVPASVVPASVVPASVVPASVVPAASLPVPEVAPSPVTATRATPPTAPKVSPARAALGAPTLVPEGLAERTARVAPRPTAAEAAAPLSAERARGTLQLVPVAPTPARAPTPRAPRRPVDLRPLSQGIAGLRAFARHHFGVRAAAAVALAALIAIVFWPRTPAPEPAATPSNTTPTPTVVQPTFAPLPQALQPAPAAATAVVPPLAPPAPLRFRNPFDASEVFEFPAGTSYVEARDQVAQLLITRARSRNELHDASTSTAPANASRAANEASLARQL